MITLERLIQKTILSDDAFICDIDDFNFILGKLVLWGIKIECCDVDVLRDEPFIVEFDEGSATIEQYKEEGGYKFFHAVDTLHVDKSIEKRFYADVRRNHTLRFELDWDKEYDDDYCDCSTCDETDCPENPNYVCETDCSHRDNCGTCEEAKLPAKEDEDKASYFVNGKKVDFIEYENTRKRIDKKVKQMENDISDLKVKLFEKLFK